YVRAHPDEAAAIAAPYIGINAAFIRAALDHCRPDVRAVYHDDAMNAVLALMRRVGYLDSLPTGYIDTTFLERCLPVGAVDCVAWWGGMADRTIVCCAYPFGYGPVAKLLHIARPLRARGLRLVFLGAGIARELAARSSLFDDVVLADPADVRSLELIRSASA